MEKERFSLLLLEPHEIYFEDFLVDLLSIEKKESNRRDDVKSAWPREETIRGRLKLCSKSLVFDPKDKLMPLIKIHFNNCIQLTDSDNDNMENNCLIVSCSQYVELLDKNIIAPYKFIRNKQKFIFKFHYVKVSDRVLFFCQQLNRASSLHASEQNDMIATMVFSLHNRSKFDPLWLDSIYETILCEYKVHEIHPLVLNPGRLILTTSSIYFQPYNNIQQLPVIKIKLDCVISLRKRRILLRQTGLEIQWDHDNNKHIYISFKNVYERTKFLECIDEQSSLKLPYEVPESMTLKWQNRVITNFEYLLYLNRLADRSFDDLTQYPIFPWIITDYVSENLDLSDLNVYRDLKKPIGALNEERLSRLKERCEEMCEPKYLYGSHYSTPGFVLFYLVRKYPHLMLCLQNGRFDHPDRMFNNLYDTFNNCMSNMSDFKELIPEFYDVSQKGDFLINVNKINFGLRCDGAPVNHVTLPPWAKNSSALFVETLNNALESDYVSSNLNHWIDLIFGYKQKGEEARKADNLFYHLCYEGSIDLDTVKNPAERHALEVQISEFGQIPKQLFDKPHVSRKLKVNAQFNKKSVETSPTTNQINDLNKLFKITLKTSYAAHKNTITSLMIDDNNIISTGKDGILKYYSMIEERQIRSIPLGDGLPLSSCVRIPESNVFAVGCWDNNILLYNSNYGKISDTIPAHEDSVSCLSICEELGILISGSWDCTVKIWKGFSNIDYKTFRLSNSMVACSSFDEKIICLTYRKLELILQIVIGAESGDILLWDVPLSCVNNVFNSDIPEPRRLLKHPKCVTSLVFNRSHTKLASCSIDGLLLVTDIATGMELFNRKLNSIANNLCWYSDLDYLLHVDINGELFFWDLIQVVLKHKIKVTDGPISCVNCSQNGTTIITAGREGKDNKIKCWEIKC